MTSTSPTAPAAAERADIAVSLRGVSKRFRRGDGTIATAIDDVSLDVAAGEFLILLGPSGCGKTTLLRTIAGLERADAGEIQVHGRPVFNAATNLDLSPDKRDLSMIFQSYALWPHLTAFENVAYPLRSRGVKAKSEIRDRVHHALELVGVAELRGQYPNQMSGGQQQRIALARALVFGGDLVLFDEPLSNVDAKVRETLRRELLEMQRELGFAAVYVTHDQHEAMELAHRIAVMGGGKVQQLGSPKDVYLRPTSRYVANFVGTSNEIPGVVTALDGDSATVETSVGAITGTAVEGVERGDRVVVSFRPENARLSTTNGWKGTVERTLFLGALTERVVRVGGVTVRTVASGADTGGPDGETFVDVPVDAIRVLPDDSPLDQPMTGAFGALQ